MTWVLLVDDHDDGREVLSEFLSFSGFDVESVGSAESALERIAEKGIPSVVVTDLTLGDMSGVELAKRIRSESSTAHVPIVAVTGRVDYDDPEKLFAEVLPKPVPLPRLVNVVKGALAK